MPIPSARTIETVNKRGRNPRQVRISKKVRDAIDVMVLEGRNRKDAAKAADITDDALYRAMRKPEVKALIRERMGDLRESAAAASLGRVNELADKARSETVKLDANKFLLGLQGISPVQRSEQHVTGDIKITAGYVLDLRSAAAPFIEGEGHEVTDTAESRRSVTHAGQPEDGTRSDDDGG